MEQEYIRKRPDPTVSTAVPARGPSIAELARGAVPTADQMGRRVDLPDRIREKMESSFGADFSGVRLYASDTVAEAGANAVTRGTNIAFAPEKLDFSTTAGQALLGHELSHVVSQARGESAGRGFLRDASLEAQADRQGMLAAQGQSVYTGPVTPVGVSAASAASGPMQAKKYQDEAAMLNWRGKDVDASKLSFDERRVLAHRYKVEDMIPYIVSDVRRVNSMSDSLDDYTVDSEEELMDRMNKGSANFLSGHVANIEQVIGGIRSEIGQEALERMLLNGEDEDDPNKLSREEYERYRSIDFDRDVGMAVSTMRNLQNYGNSSDRTIIQQGRTGYESLREYRRARREGMDADEALILSSTYKANKLV